MHGHSITAIVNYCTNDFRFLDLCMEALSPITDSIIIPVCDHFFDGTPENRELLEASYRSFPQAQFVEFAFGDQLYGLSRTLYDESKRNHFWHSTARYVGYHHARNPTDWLLFLDVDEIIDSPRFASWLKETQLDEHEAYRFDSYFYFREASRRAKTYTQNALMVKGDRLNPDHLLVVAERMGTFDRHRGAKRGYVRGLDDLPLFHHYSWVRTRSELNKKVQSWGHTHDKDWQKLLDEEFSGQMGSRDRLYGLEYESCTPLHNPLENREIRLRSEENPLPTVIKVNREDMLRLSLERL